MTPIDPAPFSHAVDIAHADYDETHRNDSIASKGST